MGSPQMARRRLRNCGAVRLHICDRRQPHGCGSYDFGLLRFLGASFPYILKGKAFA